MGVLASNRKRVDECFSVHSPSLPSPSLNSPNYYCYNSRIDTHILKKPRVCDYRFVEKVQLQTSNSSSCTVDRLRKYPEPAGNLRRVVHAPIRAKKFGLSVSSRNSGFTPLVSESPKSNKQVMGNALRSSRALLENLEKAKRKAFGTFRHVQVAEEEKREKGEVSSEDWSEVRSVVLDDGRKLRSKGLELVLESPYSGNKVSEGGVVTIGNDFDSVEAYKKSLSSVDRSYSSKFSTLDFEIKSLEAKLSFQRSWRTLKKEEEEKRRQVLKKPEEDLLTELFLPLTEEEKSEVKLALSNSNRRKVLVTHDNSNIEITGEVLQCLRPGAWLNDEVINMYLELLKERERRDSKRFLNCHFFNTFFYKKLMGRNGYDYKSVRRWTTLKKLGYKLVDCDKIFVPIHREVHWCLAVINIKDKSFQYLDSMGGRDPQVLRVLAKYYVEEVKDKCGEDIDVSSWKLDFVEDHPEQKNAFDCGVFMIKYADFCSRGIGLLFCQENMPYFRLRTAKEILKLRAD